MVFLLQMYWQIVLVCVDNLFLIPFKVEFLIRI